MRRRLWMVPAAGAAILVGLATSASVATGAGDATRTTLPALPTKPMSAANRAGITAVVKGLLASPQYEPEIPGLLIGIWSPKDGVYRASFGRSVLTSKAPPSLGSSFRIGSVSKTFAATVILQLVQEGKLSLDGRVKTYLPELAKRYPAIGTRTVRQLLGMRSGLPEYANALQKVAVRASKRVWTADELIAAGMRAGPVKPAGAAKSVYTNTNYVILGEIAEAVTGTPFPTLVRDRLLRPLGLRHTVYPSPTQIALPSPSTHGYVGPGGAAEFKGLGAAVKAGTDVTGWSPSWGNAAGMMSSTLDDLARWGNGLLGNAVLPKPLQKARLTMAPQNDSWTYGLGILQLVGGQWTGHEGGIPGWSTWVLKNVKTGTVVVTSVNACCGGAPATLTVAILSAIDPASLAPPGPPLASGSPYALTNKASLTPPPGWNVNPTGTVKGSSLAAIKRSTGALLRVVTLPLSAGQSFESLATLLHDSFAQPGTTVTPVAAFTTASGLNGVSWSTSAATGDTRTWLVTNGTLVVKVDANGSRAAVQAVRAELDRMAASVTIAS